MSISLKSYTLKYLASALFIIIAVWATLFYTFLIEEVYDNIDDGLKNLKIQIIREAYLNDKIMDINEFDFNQFRIIPIELQDYKEGNYFRTESFYMEYEDEPEPYRVLETYFRDKEGQPKRLEIRTSIVEEDEFGQNLFIALIVLYVVMVTSIITINNIILRKTWKPFYQILERLGNYELGKGNNTTKSESTNVREFKLLNSQIQKMIHRNELMFKQQKQFIENASHELQTPLAIAINKIEILLEDDTLSEEKLIELSNTRETLLKLVKINKSLLMLSRIENNQFSPREEINLNAITKNIVNDFSDMIDFKEISLELNDNKIFKPIMNPDLAYILVSNLLRNAIKYNKNGGAIRIDFSENGFSISNTSSTSESLDKSLIFNRFYKSDQDSTSTGLGLSIVKTIVDNTPNLKIDYQFEDNMHIFIVKKL
ncbi:sensor histidine kinase [Capnocytophaga felis]|uniref:histidine kinase n=1 Tax=Capnocytophaga felis TaxID=2267611 RepID=A0A5M4B9Q3_9FLAO|nr:HAMP domain-containing sensor histidine kinase [Capnocytophaga felis]GET45816.1 two-component sensor histidine kinase [Capnocytophaga felis]GET48085.1 two-component sensor histidine kinase [Capnocytophaga felis]